jgi:hypothetical protein
VTRESIKEYAAAVRRRYQVATKKEKGVLLAEFCETTGYHRKAAIRLLGSEPKVAEQRGGQRRYGVDVLEPLTVAWEALERPCGKRLAPFLPEVVAQLERHGELALGYRQREQLATISAATIDRLLHSRRLNDVRRPFRQGTSAGALRDEVAVRTSGEWKGVSPGALQADLVLHCGESTAGFYLATLTAVDVATSWCELQIVRGVGKQRVGTAMHHARQRLPFPLRELHTDNGSEFINHLLIPWCRQEQIHFTRGRPYRKNDQAFVEQKNWTAVRRTVGTFRYSSREALHCFEVLYRILPDYLNFFQPVRKLEATFRDGPRTRRVYSEARTPYQRLLDAGILDDGTLQRLERRYQSLNPVTLRAQLDRALRALWATADHPSPSVTLSVRQRPSLR